MATRMLERDSWQRYFDRLSTHLGAMRIDLLIEGLDLGVQVESERLPLLGISFDPVDDSVAILTETIEHRINHPKTIWLKEDAAGGLESFEVIDGDGHIQIGLIQPPLLLAAHR